MKICPSYQFSVLRESEYAQKMPAILEALDACRQEGFFSGFDGRKLYYEAFQAEDSRGAVVVVHGLSEFTQKYHEFAWYLLHQGYDVFLYDQRCHGRSCRLTPRQDVIHVDHFSDYYKDLHRFVCDVVRPATNGALYLYSHSMGGAVAAQYLAQYPDVFSRAVLSAPMIQPLTGGISPAFARFGLTLCMPFCDKKSKFWYANDFDPEYPFERSQDKSLARFTRHITLRVANPCYQTTPQSLRWVQQSLTLRSKLLKKRFLQKLRTPILMLCGENETVVCKKAQEDFANKCSVCRRVVLPNATHAMLCGEEETVAAHVAQVLAHFL
jgi:lysophospholipase